MRLILVRHGRSTWNAEGRLQGAADPPLCAAGRRQCERLRPMVEALAPDAVVTSDLVRARETALLLTQTPATPDARWRELDLGAWTGRRAVDLEPGVLEAWRRGHGTPPEGETWEAAQERLLDAVLDLGASGARRPLVVTHGGAIRATCELLGGPDLAHLVGVPNASLTILDTDPRPRLRAYGVAPP